MTAQSGRPPPPAPGAGAVATRSEPPMRPNYEPEHPEPQIHSMASSSTSSTINPPPLPPPQSPPLPSPPTHTIPGSLPAGSRVPKQGQRADIQQMSKSSSSSQGPLSAIVGRVGNALSSLMRPQTRSQTVYPHPMTHPPLLPAQRTPPAKQTQPEPIPILTPPLTDVDMVHEERKITRFESTESQYSRFA